MTEQQAERFANLCIGIAAIGAAYYVLKTPGLRRVAWVLARNVIAGTAPAWLLSEAMRSWDESAAHHRAARQPGI